MMSRLILRHAIWTILLFLSSISYCDAADNNERTFAIPLATVEKVVTNWLQAKGFRVYRTQISRQRTDIRAEKNDSYWYIEIVPQSALASHIRAHFNGPDPFDNTHDPYQPLWHRISRHATFSVREGRKIPRKSIPIRIYHYARAVVCMRAQINGKKKQISGFFIRSDEGLIISTAHDLTAFQDLTVTLADGQEVKGQVFILDKKLDLALIRVASAQDQGIFLNRSKYVLNPGDQLYTFGCSTHGRGELTTGYVDGPPRRADNQLLWQVQMAVLPGNSGSPVFDENGHLVAVVKGRHRVEENIGFLIPMETVKAFIRTNIDYVKNIGL